MRIIGIADGPGRISSSVRASKQEIMGRRRLVVKDCQENIKHRRPGKGTMDIPLACATLGVAREVTNPVRTFNIPFGKSIRSMNNGIASGI